MPPVVIGKKERRIMYTIIISIDILQVILTPLVVANNILDVAVGVGLVSYGVKRKLLTPKKALVLVGTFAAEQIPFVNDLPFWTYDLRNLYKGTLTVAPEPEDEDGPLYRDGVRRPSGLSTPLNQDSIRAPREV
jgi:hypothetical protein